MNSPPSYSQSAARFCRRKAMSEGQAKLAAIRVGAKTGERWYPEYCAACRVWHITKGK